MKSGIARQDLLRLLNAYLGSIAFGVSFVAASLLGVDGLYLRGAEQGAEPLSMNPAEFEKYLNDDIAKWAKVVKASGARAD